MQLRDPWVASWCCDQGTEFPREFRRGLFQELCRSVRRSIVPAQEEAAQQGAALRRVRDGGGPFQSMRHGPGLTANEAGTGGERFAVK